jgi:uncharacterized Rmd1/YagE family protein
MTPALAQIICELEAAVTERAAMVAENMQREHLGQSMAYCDGDFFRLSETMTQLAQRTREL